MNIRGLAIASGLSILLASCNDAIECAPQPIHAESDQPSPDASVAAVDVYLDHSRSMVGFLPRKQVAGSNQMVAFRTFVDGLPDIIAQLRPSGAASFTLFGGKTEVRSVTEPQFKVESSQPSSFTYDYTDIPNAIDSFASRPSDHLGVIITDLFFDTEEIGSGGTGSMLHALTRQLDQGRAVALIGILSRFDGAIYDIPPDKKRISYSGLRPVFAIVIGKTASVAAFIEQCRRAFAIDYETSPVHAVLFTPKELTRTSRFNRGDADRLAIAISGGPARATPILSDADSTGVALQTEVDAATPQSRMSLSVDATANRWRDAVYAHAGVGVTSITAWRFAGAAGDIGGASACRRLWHQLDFSGGTSTLSDDELRMQVPLTRSGRKLLSPDAVYALHVEAYLPPPTEGDLPSWIGAWTFDVNEADGLVRDATTEPMFKVFRLHQLASKLLEAAGGSRMPLFSANFVIKGE